MSWTFDFAFLLFSHLCCLNSQQRLLKRYVLIYRAKCWCNKIRFAHIVTRNSLLISTTHCDTLAPSNSWCRPLGEQRQNPRITGRESGNPRQSFLLLHSHLHCWPPFPPWLTPLTDSHQPSGTRAACAACIRSAAARERAALCGNTVRVTGLHRSCRWKQSVSRLSAV